MTAQDARDPFHRRFWRNLVGRARMAASVGLALAILWLAPSTWTMTTRALVAWNGAALFYLVAAARLMATATPQHMRERAIQIDESRYVVLIGAVLAVLAAFAAIAMELSAGKALTGWPRAISLGLSGLTILTSWTLIHTIFAQLYAHEFYIERASERALAPEDRGGLHFPGEPPHSFSDFLYFAFIIGVAAQTADVEVTSRVMRQLNLAHAVLSFFFNAIVLALTINIAAGLMN